MQENKMECTTMKWKENGKWMNQSINWMEWGIVEGLEAIGETH